MHLNNCEFNCSSQIRNPPIFICWFLLFVSHCTNFSCISNLLDSRCLHSLFIYMLFWNFRCINLNIIEVGNMVISNPQIRSSSLGLHRLSLSFWFPVDTRHRLGLHRVAFPSKQVIKGDRWGDKRATNGAPKTTVAAHAEVTADPTSSSSSPRGAAVSLSGAVLCSPSLVLSFLLSYSLHSKL